MTPKKTVVLALVLSLAIVHAPAQWVQTNGPFTGSFYSMVNSTVSGTIVAGTSMGAFKTTNAGTAWKEVLSFATYALHGGIFIPIYAATSGGLYRSTDDGTIWTKVNFPETGSVRAVTSSPNFLFASTSSQGYRSTNSGTTWDSLSFGSFNSLVTLASFRAVAATRHGIFRSTNNGVIWTQVYTLGTGQTVSRLTVAAHGELLAIADLNASPYHDVFLRSTDNGVTWNDEDMVPSTAPTMLDAAYGYTFVTTDFAYAMPPVTGGIFRSTNDGKAWSRVWETAGSMSSVAALASGVVFAGGARGMVRSLDTGKTWTSIDGGISLRHSVYSLSVTSGNAYFAGTTNGVFRSTNAGANWQFVSTDLVARKVPSLGVSTGDVVFSGVGYYGVLVDNGVLRSTNLGVTWPPGGLSQALEVNSLAALSGGEMVAGTEENNAKKGGVYHSSSGGTSWAVSRLDSIVLAVATKGTAEIFAGMKGGGISRSTDGGVAWVSRNPGVAADILALLYSPKGMWFAGTAQGVLRTTNSGTTWTTVNSGLTNLTVRALSVNRAGVLYAGTADGVFQSTNNGGLWTDFSTDLAERSVFCLSIDSTGYLLAGTRGGGVYRSTQVTVAVQVPPPGVPGKFTLEQNYPNPFNPSTTIRYGLPIKAAVQLIVFNTLGQEVAILQNGVEDAGYHDVKFDASGLSSGVYFYRIQAGDFAETKRLLILR